MRTIYRSLSLFKFSNRRLSISNMPLQDNLWTRNCMDSPSVLLLWYAVRGESICRVSLSATQYFEGSRHRLQLMNQSVSLAGSHVRSTWLKIQGDISPNSICFFRVEFPPWTTTASLSLRTFYRQLVEWTAHLASQHAPASAQNLSVNCDDPHIQS